LLVGEAKLCCLPIGIPEVFHSWISPTTISGSETLLALFRPRRAHLVPHSSWELSIHPFHRLTRPSIGITSHHPIGFSWYYVVLASSHNFPSAEKKQTQQNKQNETRQGGSPGTQKKIHRHKSFRKYARDDEQHPSQSQRRPQPRRQQQPAPLPYLVSYQNRLGIFEPAAHQQWY